MSELERRLRERKSNSEEEIQAWIKTAQEELDQSKEEGLYETHLVNDDLEETFKVLESYVFGIDEAVDESKDTSGTTAADAEMADENTPVAGATGEEEPTMTDQG